MKKKRITYGVHGMMEYQSIIRFGKNTLKVTFTGGSMNAIGVTPATYTTSNFLIQQAIENSDEFKRGRIRIVKYMELDEDLRIEHASPAPTVVCEKPSETTVAPKVEAVDSAQAVEGKSAEDAEPIAEPQAEGQDETAAEVEVEFACNDDARDYLEEQFGFVRSKLRKREDIVQAGKSRGVTITFA